jgi:hypothetical protein
MDGCETTARTQKSVVERAHVGQVRREDNLAPLCTDHAVGYRQEAMQILVAAGAGCQDVVGVFDYESVMIRTVSFAAR